MEFRRLGRSGLKVSEISYGNWLTHGSQVEADAAHACVKEALEVGITTFDTADVYAGTKAETVLGDALKGVKRESYELFTKVYWPTGKGVNERGLSRKHIIESCNASLKRLQTDHVDLYQAHRFDYETPLEETLRAFEDLVRAGKVMYVGVSEWRAAEIEEALRIADDLGFDRLVSNQPQYSALWRVIEGEIVPLCEREGVSQIVWSPIAQGVLTGKYLPGAPPPQGSRATDEAGGATMIKGFMRDDVLSTVQQLTPLAQDAGLTMAQLAVGWVLCNPNVASAIVGASRPEQVRDNAAAKALPADLKRAVDDVLAGVTEKDPGKGGSPPSRP
jgi:aryl-alcohol dehydrogenase-like predicted oxidoreductase